MKMSDIYLFNFYGSSVLERAEWSSNQRLKVFLKNEKAYAFLNVPYGVFTQLTNAESPGHFWNTGIKPFYRSLEVQTVPDVVIENVAEMAQTLRSLGYTVSHPETD